MGILNKNFYPTPASLISRMLAKIKKTPTKILEPSAGTGNIIDRINKSYYNNRFDISAIEIDEDLQATLKGKGIKVIDSDFLTFGAPDKFDLIIANPPFDRGADHLLKAIDIMFRGEIIFLLNAETIKNPHSLKRKELIRKLDGLGATIDYHQGEFVRAERKTSVEVALIYININNTIEEKLFNGITDGGGKEAPEHKEQYDLTTGKDIPELVAEYNKIITVGTESIINFFKNYRTIGKYLSLNDAGGKDAPYRSSSDLTSQMQDTLNQLLVTVRTDYWRRTLELKEVRRRLTEKKNKEFEETLKQRCNMDFTENNIRQFVLNLIEGHTKTLTEATLDIFDLFTRRHCFEETIHEKNVHYFNGWKTNKSFKIGKKVIIPITGGYGEGAFRSYGAWKLDYSAKEKLRDIDIVMNYFDGYDDYLSISDALEDSFARGDNKVSSSYFDIIAHKKGTIHLTFRDMGILRRFNVAACLGKGWLPNSYGSKKFNELSHEEKSTVSGFEDERTYNKNVGKPIFSGPGLLQLT